MELTKVFKSRRSVRKYKNKDIDDNIINSILEAANSAPCTDSCNYYFGVIKDNIIKNKIAESTIYADWVSSAPVIFVCCSNINYDIKDDEPNSYVHKGMTARYGTEIVEFLISAANRKGIKTLMQSTPIYIAAQHIILSAVSHGLKGCLVDFINLEAINNILKLPDNISCELLVPVGYPDEIAKPVNSNDKDNIFFDTWNKS